MHHEAAWYLEWVVKEGIEFKPHAKHLAPGLRVSSLVATSWHALLVQTRPCLCACLQLLGYYKNKIPSTPPTKAAPNPASAPSTARGSPGDAARPSRWALC